MMIQNKTALIYLLLILIGVAFVAYGAWSGCNGNSTEPSEAQKYAELEAALGEVAATGKVIESESKRAKGTAASRPSRMRST